MWLCSFKYEKNNTIIKYNNNELCEIYKWIKNGNTEGITSNYQLLFNTNNDNNNNLKYVNNHEIITIDSHIFIYLSAVHIHVLFTDNTRR